MKRKIASRMMLMSLLANVLTITLVIAPFASFGEFLRISLNTGKTICMAGGSIDVYGNLTWNSSPVEALVALQLDDPVTQSVILRTLKTGESFQVGPVEMVEFYSSDQFRIPKDTFQRGGLAYFTITVNNTALETKPVLVGAVNAYDSEDFNLGLSASFEAPVPPGETTFTFSLWIPAWASTGTATAYANAYTTWPHMGGTPYGFEATTTFTIIDGTTQGSTTRQTGQTKIDAATGNYSLTFKLSAAARLGNYTIYVTSSYQGETAANNAIVLVTILGDVNGDRRVDILDAGSISAHWYPGPPVGPLGYDPNADINSDGSVNILDAGIVSANWGKSW